MTDATDHQTVDTKNFSRHFKAYENITLDELGNYVSDGDVVRYSMVDFSGTIATKLRIMATMDNILRRACTEGETVSVYIYDGQINMIRYKGKLYCHKPVFTYYILMTLICIWAIPFTLGASIIGYFWRIHRHLGRAKAEKHLKQAIDSGQVVVL